MRLTIKNGLLLMAVLTISAGCGKGEKATTQVVAKVNSEEISVHQVNAVLSNVIDISAEGSAKVKREILDKLIDQKLAVQQAMEKHLDRTPNVMQSIEAAKAGILARAYQEQVASTLPKSTTGEARKFYDEHPELFSQRRIYNLQEITLAADEKTLADIRQQVAQGQSLHEITSNLKQKNVRFGANTSLRSAEQLPFELLPKYHSMKDGQTQVIETPPSIIVASLISSQSQPVDEVTAIPQIQNYLNGQQALAAIARDTKQLRAQAKIEYLGEFAAEPR